MYRVPRVGVAIVAGCLVTGVIEQHAELPYQSTVDQFFSESQFESYRRHAKLELVHEKPWDKAHRAEASPAELIAGTELMQLVQNVYTEFGFQHAVNRATRGTPAG